MHTPDAEASSVAAVARPGRRGDRLNVDECPLLAQSGHSQTGFRCLLLGVKRTLRGRASVYGSDPQRR